MSLQVSAIMNQLKSVGFLNGLELECPGLYLQNYARKHILKAVRLWITLCGEHRLLMPISEFLACMKSYQQHSGENYDLDDVDLQKLFWLVEAGSDGNEKNEPCIQLTQFALLFVWIGSSQLQNVFDTKTVINLLYDWIHEDPIRIGNYYGFCSKKMVEEILEQNPGYPMYIPVYYLHEGYLGSMQYIQNDNIYHSIKYIIRNAASACLVDPVSGSGDYVVRHRLLLRHDMCGNAEIDPSANFESAGIDSVDTLLS